MRLDRYFETGMKPTAESSQDQSIPLQAFVFGPAGSILPGQWADVYRLAYERTIAALRPTRYEWVLKASAN